MTGISSSRRPGRRPDNSKRITKDTDLPPSMESELKKAGVFKSLGLSRKDAETSDIISGIDRAARRYLHVYQGGISGYPVAEDQREIAEKIGRRAKRLSKAIVEDPEVSKRFFLALENRGDQKLVGSILKAGPKLQDKEKYLQSLLNEFVKASQIAQMRSVGTRGRPPEYETEMDLACWVFNETPSIFKRYCRPNDKGGIKIKREGRKILEQLVRQILTAALMLGPLKNTTNKYEIELDSVDMVAEIAVEKFAKDHEKNSHEWTTADEQSDNEISKDRWYPKKKTSA